MSRRRNGSSARESRGPGMTRRDFVQTAAVGLALAALPSLPAPSRAEEEKGSSGASRARIEGNVVTLGNESISARWEITSTGLRLLELRDPRGTGSLAAGTAAFTLALDDDTLLDSSRMELREGPRLETLRGDPGAARLSDRLPGKQIVAMLRDREGRVEAGWKGILREGSHYIREEVTLWALGGKLPLGEATLVDLPLEGASVAGTVRGSPAILPPWFFALEHPLSSSRAGRGRVRCLLERNLPLQAGRTLALSSVKGIARPGQLRRDFLRYLERERAHPYRPFLHYNSWYDLGYFTPFDEAAALEVIRAFGTELHRRRGVVLDSFLFDDGWDDHRLWGFNAGFPRGFLPLRRAAERYGAEPGVWLSPWGGYGKPREERLKFGREQGFETNADGFALSGPVYYKRFRDVCLEMIRAYGVNQFKIDGTGDASTSFPGSEFGSDFEAAIQLISDLRGVEGNLFINLTTGTYPSPFWLRYADSIWRGGDDHAFAGVGSRRQRWITYRDADTFQNVVLRGPLYPLNSLMLHGMIYARHARDLNSDPGGDFISEIRSYFGTGTQLQEMYITPSLLTKREWDVLAEAARWSRSRAGVLVDSHWVGGDPARLEPYGWASWTPARGILTLRNPGDQARSLELDAASIFELPENAPESYGARNAWGGRKGTTGETWRAGVSRTVRLDPFQVLTLEFTPA